MRLYVILTLLLIGPAALRAQSLNALDSALNLNANALDAIFEQVTSPPPLTRPLLTDSPFTLNLRATPNTPVVLLWAGSTTGASVSIGAANPFPGIQIDIADQGAPGYADQVLVDGYAAPWPSSFTDAAGDWSLCTSIPSCSGATGSTSCLTIPSFEVAAQALTVSVNPPFNIRTTGAVRGDFTNGYASYDFTGIANNEFAFHPFTNGFVFTFYGANYSGVWISENGYVQFGSSAGMGLMAGPTLGLVNGSPPRIMSYFNDLDPDVFGSSPEVIVQQTVSKNGLRQVTITHRGIEEFGAASGPHGGTITLSQNGEIAVFVDSSNLMPSINTIVGVSPGGAPVGAFPNPVLGFDLSALNGTGFDLGPGRPCFEVFDHGFPQPTTNAIDLAGLGAFNGSPFGPGIVFVPNPALAVPGYIVQ